MSQDELKRVERLFHEAVELGGDERGAYLDEACGDDVELRRRVEAMLSIDRADESFPGLPGLEAEAVAVEGPGDTIGRYKLLEAIGEGGFGVVYLAEQREPVVRRVALKVIKLGMDTAEVIARFEAERQALALMDHPNIARVLDAGATDAGRPYFVMELVAGVAITEFCDQRKLSTRERLDLFAQVCHAVQHAHQKGVIHRDIKPSNVLVTLHDGVPVPKVIDFGIAKAMHTRLTERTLFTRFQRFLGTPAYMSPEQAEMSGLDIDTRSDVYSLGVLLYELLTGTTPFDPRALIEQGLGEIQRVLREEPPQRPSARISTTGDARVADSRGLEVVQLSRLLRGDLDWIVLRALEKDRNRRYATALEMARDVRRYLADEPVEAGPPSAIYRARKFLARNRAAVGVATLVLAVLLGGILATWLALQEARIQRDEAEAQADAATYFIEFLVSTLELTDPEVALDPDVPVRRLLESAVERLDSEFAGSPAAEARVRATIGRAYHTIGLFEPAEVQLRRSIQLVDDHGLELDPIELYATLWKMTDTAFRLERPDSFVFALRSRVVGTDHVAEEFPALGADLMAFSVMTEEVAHGPGRQKVDAANALFDDLRQRAEAALGPGDPRWPIVADTFKAGALTMWHSPFEPETARYWEEVVRIQTRELTAVHPSVGESINMLVGVLNRAGRADEAEERIRGNLAVVREALPPGHLQIAFAESGLGECLVAQRRYAEAEPYLLSSHDVTLRSVGRETFHAFDSFARVVGLYDAWGRPDEAAPFRAELAALCATYKYLMIWPIMSQTFGPERPELRALVTRGHELTGGPNYLARAGGGSGDGLRPIVDGIVATCRDELEHDDPLRSVSARLLLGWMHALDPEGAAELRAHIAGAALELFGVWRESVPRDVADAEAALAAQAARDGDPDLAMARARAAWSVLSRAEVGAHWISANADVRIADALSRAGLHLEAEELARRSHAFLEEQLGPTHADVRTAQEIVSNVLARRP